MVLTSYTYSLRKLMMSPRPELKKKYLGGCYTFSIKLLLVVAQCFECKSQESQSIFLDVQTQEPITPERK
jgi:hypothetical protein